MLRPTLLKLYAMYVFMVFEFFFDVVQKEALVALFVLIVMDFGTAMYATIKSKRKIKSSKILRTALKISFYFLMISASFLAEKAIPLNFLDDAVIAFLAATELLSILENVSKAGYAIPNKVYKKLQEFIGEDEN